MKGTMVRHAYRCTAVFVVALGLVLTACGGAGEEAAPSAPASTVVLPDGGIQVSLTPDAAERLDVTTAPVQTVGGSTTIPYSAVLYDPDGATWTYTNPEPNVFIRAEIAVDRIDGDQAILTSGPAAGTAVVTVGATELWGVEYGGIEED